MKDYLKKLIITNIEKWNDNDIYAISLFVNDLCDNPCKPTVTLGYNTNTQVAKILKEASSEIEARWNYAFWIQNNFFCFGDGDTSEIVKKWLKENKFPYYDDDDSTWDTDEAYDEAEEITEAFISVLISIVKEIHEQKLLTIKYGKELPIIIHELEYYDEIAEQNIEANGKRLVKEFADFCYNS
jgi:hypothetical protein